MLDNTSVYPVYILSRVVENIYNACCQAVPHETLGRLIGYRLQWNDVKYIKVVDWVGGEIESSHTHARFTHVGTQECEIFLDERYRSNNRPVEVGLFHSHPFNSNPQFSETDYQTFLNFPYDKEGNVFILIDPLSTYFKTFVIQQVENQKQLKQVEWIEYEPCLIRR